LPYPLSEGWLDSRRSSREAGQSGTRAWGSGRPAWNQGPDFSKKGVEAKASRLLWGIFGNFSESLPIPADASGAYHPPPQAPIKPTADYPPLNGYVDKAKLFDIFFEKEYSFNLFSIIKNS